MTKRQWFLLSLAVALSAGGLGLAASHVLARGPVELGASSIVPAVPVPAELGPWQYTPSQGPAGLDVRQVLDQQEYRSASDFARRVTPYVHLDAGGVPRLDPGVTAEGLGVTPEFLRDFSSALDFAGEAVREGRVVVKEDLTVQVRQDQTMQPEAAPVAPGGVVPGALGQRADDPSVDWQTWGYNSGAMFFNSYDDYWRYFHNRYYVLCSSMAAQLGFPWMSPNLVYYYAYNGWSFNQYLGPSSGMYWFLPFSGSGCYSYNPCFCCGLSYRTIYIWVQSYQYFPSCRCHQAVWGWQGFWARF